MSLPIRTRTFTFDPEAERERAQFNEEIRDLLQEAEDEIAEHNAAQRGEGEL